MISASFEESNNSRCIRYTYNVTDVQFWQEIDGIFCPKSDRNIDR